MAFFDRVQSWVTVEPAVALLMLIAAIVIFGTAFARSRDASSAFWPWLRRVVEAAVIALLFLGILWAFRSILNSNRAAFFATHGSRSDANLESAYSIWGRPHVQRELSVAHHVVETVNGAEVRQHRPQNSITGFEGETHLTVSEREKGYAYYSGFEADVNLTYEVANVSDEPTEADFYFPLPPSQTLLEDFLITSDGEDIGAMVNIGGDMVTWTEPMQPHQRKEIAVSYRARGMEYFYYQIPAQREIRNFSLTITVDRLPVSLVNYPEGCLTPTDLEPTPDGRGSILSWTFDRTITTAGMGVALPQPEQPGANVLRGLERSPYALTLLIATLGLTLVLLGEPIRFLDLALLAAVYCLEFLLMASISDTVLGFWGSLAAGAALTSLLAYLLYRRHPSKLLRALVAGLVLFFTVVYPLAGLLTDLSQRTAFDALVQVGLIVYLFGLALVTRLRRGAPAVAAEAAAQG